MSLKRNYSVICLMSFVLFASCGEKIDPGNQSLKSGPAVKARVLEAKISQAPQIHEAMGTVQAKTASTVSAKLMGTVLSVNVREGDAVSAGTILAKIDARQVQAMLDQATAGLAQAQNAKNAAQSANTAAQAARQLAQATYRRYLLLKEKDAVSAQEFEEVEARAQQADAGLAQAEAMEKAANDQVRQAQAAVEAARISLSDANVKAPYSGVITAKMIEAGDLAAPGKPLFKIQQSNAFEARMSLAEPYIGYLRMDQLVNVRVPAANLTLSGKVVAIDPAADPAARAFEIRLSLESHPALRSGMFARIEIPLDPRPMILIPATAVVIQGQLTGVFQVDEKSIARFRLIRIGQDIDGQVEAISGLQPGDRFVSDPNSKLVDGAKVEAAS